VKGHDLAFIVAGEEFSESFSSPSAKDGRCVSSRRFY